MAQNNKPRSFTSPTKTLFIFVAIIFSGAFPLNAETIFPNPYWAQRNPTELNINATLLDSLATQLGGRGCIIKDGYIIKSWGDQSEKGDWLSSAKPVLSTLLFFAIEQKLIPNVNAPIADLGWPLKPKDQSMTFAHLANMVSGYARPDAPGTAWAYNDFGIQLYQKSLFDKVFKDQPETVAAQCLHPLHLEDGLSFRETNRRLSASVRDFARIAWFWCQKGNWNGTQVLPRHYFDTYQKPQNPKNLPHTQKSETDDYLSIGSFGGGSDHFTNYGAGIYGFNWWFNETGHRHPKSPTWPDAPKDTIMSIGAGGNNTVIIPSLNLVLASAKGDWGKLEAGDATCKFNQYIKLLVQALPQP